MTTGYDPEPGTGPPHPGRVMEPADWSAAGIPLLTEPRETVKDLHARHRPTLLTAVVAVLDTTGRLTASASFDRPKDTTDGWEHRNAILSQLRRVTSHDLRLRAPARTAVLMLCREGEPGWTENDGAWMWGLRDASSLYGLRCGAYITLTRGGWRVLGEGRGGRTPYADSWTARPDPRGSRGTAPHSGGGAPGALRRAAAR